MNVVQFIAIEGLELDLALRKLMLRSHRVGRWKGQVGDYLLSAVAEDLD